MVQVQPKSRSRSNRGNFSVATAELDIIRASTQRLHDCCRNATEWRMWRSHEVAIDYDSGILQVAPAASASVIEPRHAAPGNDLRAGCQHRESMTPLGALASCTNFITRDLRQARPCLYCLRAEDRAGARGRRYGTRQACYRSYSRPQGLGAPFRGNGPNGSIKASPSFSVSQ
jgi:hypothetical protein